MTARTAHLDFFEVKKIGYLFYLLMMALPFIAAYLGLYYGVPNLAAFFTLVFAFVLVPALDHLVGHDSVNPDAETAEILSRQYYYRFLTLLTVPLQLLTIAVGIYYFKYADMNLLGCIGWLLSIGLVTSGIGITVAHELIHKNERIERWAGGLLLASVCYSTFKVEHIRGHHVWVGTPNDKTTAKYNQTLYQFLRCVIPGNFISGWRLEAQRLQRKGLKPFSRHNELIWWHLVTAALALGFGLIWGWLGVGFFFLQGLVAILVLEVINYVEHYGLARKQLETGQFEPVNEGHSWNSDYLISNLLLFQLQRHSDHHRKPKHRYQILAHHDVSPQLPSGYPAMMLLALFPSVWFKVMNHRVPKSNFH